MEKSHFQWNNFSGAGHIGDESGLNSVCERLLAAGSACARDGGGAEWRHLMVSEDLREVDPERLEMIRRLLPAYPDAARPLDLFEKPSPEGYPSLWSLSLRTGFGPMTVLALFNITAKSKQFEIRPEMLGIQPGRRFLALEW